MSKSKKQEHKKPEKIQIPEEKKAAVKKLWEETLTLANQSEQTWVELYLHASHLKNGLIGKTRYYEILGFGAWADLRETLLKKFNRKKSQFNKCLSAVASLVPEEAKALGSTRSIQAARLVKAKLWNNQWFERLKKMNADEAALAVKEAIRKKLGKLDESHIPLHLNLLKSQKELWDKTVARIKKLLSTDSMELVIDFILSSAAEEVALQEAEEEAKADEVEVVSAHNEPGDSETSREFNPEEDEPTDVEEVHVSGEK